MGDWTQIGENLVRHVGGTIYLRAKVGGKVIRKSLETSDLRIAKLMRDETLESLRGAAGAPTKAPDTVGKALAIVRARMEAQTNLKPSSRRYYRYLFKALEETLPLSLHASRWTVDVAGEWWKRFSDGRSDDQSITGLRVVRKLGEVLIDAHMRRDNPAAKIKPAKRKNRDAERQLPTAVELDALIADVRAQKLRCSEEAANMIEFLAWSGLRINELRNVQWQHIGTEWVTITGGKDGTKNRTSRTIPINGRLRALLDRLQEPNSTGPLFYLANPRAALSGACKRAGIPHMRIHDLRHWFATHAIERGVDIPTVAKWLGHKDKGVLAMKIYGHLRDDHSLEAAKKMG